MATTEELTALLKEAEQAYHDLVLGLDPKVIVHQNGQRTEYNTTTRNALKSYIEELKASLAALGASVVPGYARRPMRVWF